MNHEMGDFDWVKARAECSATEIFEKLRIQVQKDVDRWKALKVSSELKVSTANEAGVFAVSVDGVGVYRGVRFSLEENAIVVDGIAPEKRMFLASVTLSDDGECRLKITGKEKEYDLWQFRKLALEWVLFG